AVDGVLVTPPVESGVLAGITRRAVLELAGRLDLPHEERRVTPEELHRSQEAFVTSTALGVMPLVAVEGTAIGKGVPGPVTIRLRAAYLGELGVDR
ncbi:MAG TPA: aminotransferase class IV, partial [Chloroflexota bacterium]|nr:aminotransferase class IV [Chloroflexota bacterium]